jgi:putative integral membrane protein (TIGR02587 family)
LNAYVLNASALLSEADRRYAVSLARAFGGALLFSLPILMTMETWRLGWSMDPLRLALLLIVTLPLLVGLAYYLGFEESTRMLDAVLDAFVAVAAAALLTAALLYIFGALDADAGAGEWVGKVALQTLGGSMGALLAQTQFGADRREEERKRRASGRFGEYFFMAAGALFLSANIAPTEEVALIAYMMSPWRSIALVAISLTAMHAFVYAVGFAGQHERALPSAVAEFVRFTLIGYLLALAIAAYVCWSFGHLDGAAPSEALDIIVVLGFPAAVGAAAARLVL